MRDELERHVIVVNRIGFLRSAQEPDLTPETKLQAVLAKMVERGHRLVSVSVLNGQRPSEAYEVYIVSDHK